MDDTGRDTTRVQVVCRVRPVLAQEGGEVAVSVTQDGARVQVQLPDRGADAKELVPGTTRLGARSYGFDACLPGRTTQAELADSCGLHELVGQALDGYNITIFAFGQTGSGKTHSIIGPRISRGAASTHDFSGTHGEVVCDEEDGLLPRCIQAAYAGIQQRSDQVDIQVSTSCVELYNEAATDLLAADKSKQLQVRKDERGGFKVQGLVDAPCETAQQALNMCGQALVHRHTRAHALNEYSSRSHCLMTFTFNSQEKDTAGGDQGAVGGVRRHGKLVLVDLAGSERLKDSGTRGAEAVRETGTINRSLFTLGQVLAALASRGSGRLKTTSNSASQSMAPHVPYRDSKLTQLLWDGLRGNGRVLMLACVAPMSAHAEETLNTLHFASMALRIKSQPVILLDPQDALVLELRSTIKQLKEDKAQLSHAMSLLSSGAEPADVLAALPEQLRLAARDGLKTAPPAEMQHQTELSPSGKMVAVLASSDWSHGQHAAGKGQNRWGARDQGDNKAGQHRKAVSKPDIFTVSSVLQPTAYSPSHASQAYLDSLLPSPTRDGYMFGAPRSTASPVKARRHNSKQLPSISPPKTAPRALMGVVQPPNSLAAYLSPTLGLTALGGQSGAAGSPPRGLLEAEGSSVALQSFPELAALEAQFQQRLLGQGEGSDLPGNGDDFAGQAATDTSQPALVIKPEPKALNWAQRNTWFGLQHDMTAYAYEVHDNLVSVQHVDAASDEYYDSIEQRVKDKFPEQWAAWEAEVAAAAKAAAEAAAAARQAAALRARAAPPPRNFGAAFRDVLKEPLPLDGGNSMSWGPDGMFKARRGFANPRLRQTQEQCHAELKQPAKPTVGQQASLAGFNPVGLPLRNANARNVKNGKAQAGLAAASGYTMLDNGGNPSATAGSTHNGGMLALSKLNAQSCQHSGQQPGIRNSSPIGALPTRSSHSTTSQGSSSNGQQRASRRTSQQKTDMVQLTAESFSTGVTWQQLQSQYTQQRHAVLEQLRVAKQDAEREHQAILAKIGRTLSTSRWRS